MDNNNMDDFFRQHSHTMDEAPGDALWQRIEQQLPPVSTGFSQLKTSFSGSKFLLVLMVSATAIVAGIVSMRNRSKEVLQPAVVLSTDTVITETAAEQDTVKKKKPVKKTTENAQALPFRRINKPNNKQKVTDVLAVDDLKQTTITPQPAPEPKVIKTTVAYNPKRTIVTINEVVSQHTFDSITKVNIEKYKDHAGMQLIVKEPRSGHIFRTKFENAFKPGRLTFEQKKDSLATNGMKLVIPKTESNISTINVNFDSLKKVNNTLSPEVITFKNDTTGNVLTAPYRTKASTSNKIYSYNELTVQPEFPGKYSALATYLSQKIRIPPAAFNKNISLRAHILFTIEKDGSISEIQVVKDPGYGLGEEMVRVFKTLTIKWKPAEVNNETVRTKTTLPFTIVIKE